MADKDFYSRLKRLFSTNVVVRNIGGRRLKIADTEQAQALSRRFLVDRFTKLYSNIQSSSLRAEQQYKAQQRLGLFKDYEQMDQDPIIASALDIYSDESTVDNIEGEILKIRTDNTQVNKILHNLFYDIINIEFNLWSWIRNMTKYGDFYLRLDIVESSVFGSAGKST